MSLGPYWTGDVPSQSPEIEVTREGLDTDLAAFNNVTFTLRGPAGQIIEDIVGGIEDGVIVFDWPTVSLFDTIGIYTLHPVLTALLGYRETADPIPFVVQGVDGWHTLASARRDWPDAPDNDVWLWTVLAVARTAVEAFAPALAGDPLPPLHYRQGQMMQARNVWNAAKVDPSSGGLGEGEFVMRPFPLDWMVRQVLRPKTAIPRIG